ncbi:ATP/GTP-binding protein [Ferrovibrio sp.]|uniref:AAA family ATPase n=1 Tax=Ferrovibrio sp. TaxID=1917215 RepID=UPI0035AFBEE5
MSRSAAVTKPSRKKSVAKPQAGKSPIPSIHIKGYKCFSDLSVARFGAVNLIVGANSVGKSALLEAIRLYASRCGLIDLAEILINRDEMPAMQSGRRQEIDKGWFLANLFSGDTFNPKKEVAAAISVADGATLKLVPKIRSRAEKQEADRTFGSIIGRRFDLEIRFDAESQIVLADDLLEIGDELRYARESIRHRMRIVFRHKNARGSKGLAVYLSPQGMSDDALSSLWDNVALTDDEVDVIAALRIIAPDIEKISFIGSDKYDGGLVPMIRQANSREPVALRRSGDGMTRLLGIALALVNARDGVLLIDEIENGIHYSVQGKLWQLIVNAAKRLNVQVFATTHSFDCIEAFSKTANEMETVEGRLIKLYRNGDNASIQAIEFDESELKAITKSGIEVR